MLTQGSPFSEEGRRANFNLLDVNSKGELDLNDLRYISEQLKYGYDDDQLIDIIHQVGGYGAETVSWEKFNKFVERKLARRKLGVWSYRLSSTLVISYQPIQSGLIQKFNVWKKWTAVKVHTVLRPSTTTIVTAGSPECPTSSHPSKAWSTPTWRKTNKITPCSNLFPNATLSEQNSKSDHPLIWLETQSPSNWETNVGVWSRSSIGNTLREEKASTDIQRSTTFRRYKPWRRPFDTKTRSWRCTSRKGLVGTRRWIRSVRNFQPKWTKNIETRICTSSRSTKSE